MLVGSEGGSTWGFAATLHAALDAAGQSVHAAPMSTFAPNRYAHAERIIVLAATYGDGDAPASAKGFFDRLEALDRAPDSAVAVLGFGDRSFPAYCAFARAVAAAAEAKGWRELLPFDTIDRQSPQDFARWGRALGQALGIELELAHQPVLPATETLTFVSRRDYGVEVQAPTAILRFALPRATLWQRLTGRGFARFAAGDLLGIVPEGSVVPRFYSLASGSRDGFVEIVVRKHPGGLCSGQLIGARTGRRRIRLPPTQPRFPGGSGPRAPDPDRGGNRYRSARRFRAGQCAAASHPSVLRDAPPRQRLPLRRGTLHLADRWTPASGSSRRSRGAPGPTTCRMPCAPRAKRSPG